MENLTQVTPRHGIITFDNGQRIKAEFYIKPRRWYSYEDYEKKKSLLRNGTSHSRMPRTRL